MRVEVTVKVGEIEKSSRTTISYTEPAFQIQSDESFESLAERVEENVTRAMTGYEHRVERIDRSIYIRPSATSPQRQFVVVSAENYREQIVLAQANFGRRKKSTGPFVCELFVFLARPEVAYSNGIRRATASRISEAAVAVDEYLQSHPEQQVGEIARTHWVLTQARQPESAGLVMPETATFRQMRHIDAMRDASPAPTATNEYGSVTVRLNGSSDLSLSVNIRELRAALGLPPYSLLAAGVFNTFVPPPPPVENVEDDDHKSDSDDI